MNDRSDQVATGRIVRVDLGERGYDVIIDAGILDGLGARLRTAVRASRAMTAFDGGVPAEHTSAAIGSLRLAGLGDAAFGHTLNEESKAMPAVERLVEEMVAAGLERSDVLVAIGGGLHGDVAGFAAAVYRRGIPWVNVPTTLLAMTDASVGGKTGVNAKVRSGDGASWELRKNMAGAFHQPALVVCDALTLASLPEREFRSGLAECIKHGLIAPAWGDAGLLEWTGTAIGRILRQDPQTLVELVARNVQVKAAVVAADERETPTGPDAGRMSLNLGHTFAHALESQLDLGLSHGEAVSLGLLAAATLAELLGKAGKGLRSQLERLLGPEGAGLPTRVGGLAPASQVLDRMMDDKKVAGGKLRLVVADGMGRVEVIVSPPREVVAQAIDSIRV